MILEKAAVIVNRRVGRIDARDLEGRAFVAARETRVPVHRIIVRVEFVIHALRPQREVTRGAREVGGDAQWSGVVASSDSELIGVGLAVRRALEAPGLERSAGVIYVAADDRVAIVAEDQIGRISAPDRLRPRGVVDPLAIALP